MRMLKRLFCALSACLCCVLAFSGMSLNASADSSTKAWSAAEWESLFSVVQGQYLGSDLQYHACEFRAVGAAQLVQDNIYTGYQSFVGRTVLWYKAYTSSDSNIPIQAFYNSQALYDSKLIMNFDFTFTDCNYCSIGFLSYCYPDSEYSAFLGTDLSIFEQTNTNCWAYGNDSYIRTTPYVTSILNPCLVREQNHNRFLCTGGLAPVSQAPGNVHFKQLDFALVGSNTVNDGSFVAVVLPVTNSEAQLVLGGSDSTDWGDADTVGEMTGIIEDNGDGSQNINVTVNTDNSGFLAGILNGIKRIFIPSDDFLTGWHDDIQDSFEEHLGGVAEAVTLIDEQADYLRAATSADYIYFPELTLPIGSNGSSGGVETLGADYTLIQGQQVELRPARTGKLKILWDFVEFAVDVVCVLAVFNMLQTKYEIFLNPDGEVISYDS